METVESVARLGYTRIVPARTYNDPNKINAKDAIALVEEMAALKRSIFYFYVDMGVIPRHVPPWGKQGYYLRSEIEEFVARLKRGDVPPVKYPPRRPRTEEDGS